MYKLIIIDDEYSSATQFGSAINWGSYGFCLDRVFSDSEEALEYLEKNSADLIFTDIRMPKYSGMDIAKFCSAMKKPPFVVFISAYSEFEYARQAIKYKIFDYLTKPFSFSDIEKILVKVYNTLLEQSSGNELFASNLELLEQQHVFSELILGNVHSKEELNEQISTLNLPSFILESKCAQVSVTINNFDDYIQSTWKHGTDKLYNAISYISQSKNKLFCCNWAYAGNTFEIIAIDLNRNFDSEFKVYTEQLKTNLIQLLSLEDITISFQEISSLSDFVTEDFGDSKEAYGDDVIIKKSIKFMHENYKKDISLNDVAKYVSLSRVYFCSYFKKITGENFVDTLNRYRVEKAKELLDGTTQSVSSVAETVGYKSIPYFYKIFAKITNLTPNEYRNRKEND